MKLYVVTGTSGEYSDRSEWLVRAFRSEEDSINYVEFLSRKFAEACGGKDDYWDIDNREIIEETMKEFDPKFWMDYTGTSWYIRTVEMDD